MHRKMFTTTNLKMNNKNEPMINNNKELKPMLSNNSSHTKSVNQVQMHFDFQTVSGIGNENSKVAKM